MRYMSFRYLRYLWKHKALTKFMGRQYSLNHNIIEVDITYACNLKCFNCNRSCRSAISNDSMTVDQIEKFIKESIKQKRKWEWINILGGEPTLHTQIFEIVNILLDYKNNNSNKTRIRLFSNGYGPVVNNVLRNLPNDIEIINTNKEDNTGKNSYSLHDAFNMAPIDDNKYLNSDFSNGCHIINECGGGLNMFGYYPCAIAGAIDRVVGYNVGDKNLPEPSNMMYEKLDMFCRLCGHFKPPQKAKYETISSSWKSIYKNYNKEKPVLSFY